MNRYAGIGIPMVLVGSLLSASEPERIWVDPAGDGVVRRTDPGADGPLRAGSRVPDLLALRVGGWAADDPLADPYTGAPDEDAHLLRVQLEIDGLVNPLGTVGVGGLGYDPFAHGMDPVAGIIEFDIDKDTESGGELGATAEGGFLANVGRFGTIPYDLADRAAREGVDLDTDFATPPQYERSGADFMLILCGCDPVTVVSEGGNADGVFDAGERWIVRSRYFQRAGGYRSACASFGGSAGGLYDPLVNLLFEHDPGADRTTVTLVFALDQAGAAMLTGEPEQPIDVTIDIGGNHASVVEAVQDIIDGAEGLNGPVDGPTHALIDEWNGDEAHDFLEAGEWRATVLLGTVYETPEPTTYVWTDVGFDLVAGDVDGNGLADTADRTAIDGDLGRVSGLGTDFSVLDLDGSGVIDEGDLDAFSLVCSANVDTNGRIDIIDLLLFLTAWFDGDADLDNDGDTGVTDLLLYLSLWFVGC